MNNNHSSNAPQSGNTLQCCCGLSSNSLNGPVSQNEHIQRAIHILKLGWLSFFSALLKVLDPTEDEFSIYCDRIYACPKDGPDGKLAQLLNCLNEDPRGKAQLLAWMEQYALQSVARKVYDETNNVKRLLSGTIEIIEPDFLLKWDINSTVGKITEGYAPVLIKILESAARSDRALRKNKLKDISTVGLTRPRSVRGETVGVSKITQTPN